MYYPENVIEDIRVSNDIVDVISNYVKLQKKGGTYFGLCPFHNEKTASFSVSPAKQMFYCFGCGEGGNVFSFIMKYENMTFQEAVKMLADRAGISLPEIEYTQEERKKADLKSVIYEINKEVGKYFFYQLKSEKGNLAYDYFKKRELTEETIVKFGLGYASRYSDDLYKYLRTKGYKDEILKETGLFSFKETGTYDLFWNRVMFPIMDVSGKVIGFGGRIMGDGEPKYLNSPETKVFDKSRNLFGLNIARTSRKNYLIICEGYMDVISMHQAGFNNAVASLGTALTSGQASLLKRYTGSVILSYDNDNAGKKATLRAIPILKEVGLSVRVINLSPYKDPDEFIKNMGNDEFEKRIEEAENSFLYEVNAIRNRYNINDPEEKTQFETEIIKKLLSFEDELERENYMRAVCSQFQISYDLLSGHMRKYALSFEGITKKERPKVYKEVKVEKEDAVIQCQKLLLTWLLDNPELFGPVTKYISEKDFFDPIYNKVAVLLFEQIRENNINPAKIINEFESEEEHKIVAGLFNASLGTELEKKEMEKAITDAVVRVKINSLEQEASKITDLKVLSDLFKEKEEIKKIHITI